MEKMKTVFILLVVCIGFCTSQNVLPGYWCDSFSVWLPSSLPFTFTQPNWTIEYFYYTAPVNQTVYFKIYPGITINTHLWFVLADGDCGRFLGDIEQKWPGDVIYSSSTAQLQVDAIEGHTYSLFVHMVGGNFTIMGCEGQPCDTICPGDCTSSANGICNLNTKNCECTGNWNGASCASDTTPVIKKKPFGSYVLFYTVVAGIPSCVVIGAIFVAIVYVEMGKKSKKHRDKIIHQQTLKEQTPLLSPSSLSPASRPTRS